MIKLKKIIKEIMDAVPQAPQQNVQHVHSNILSSDFTDYIKTVENGIKKGFDKQKKMWLPYEDSAGWHIGYGHKMKNTAELESMKNGMTDSQITDLLKRDLQIAEKNVNDYIKRTYKVNFPLSQKQKEMLVDFTFNLGGLEKFPKMTDAILRNQWDIVKKEYIRKAQGKELTGRNTAFFNRFLK